MKEIEKTLRDGKPYGHYMYVAGCEWSWEPIEMANRNLDVAKALNEKIGIY